MRTTFSSVAFLASSLLAREVFAAPYMQKRDVVTDIVMVTEEITVTQEADGTFETGLPVAIGTTTINGTPVVVSETPAATPSSTEAPATKTPAPAVTKEVSSTSESSSSAPGAVFIQQPSTTKASDAPKATIEPTSTAAAVVPTTSAVEKPTTFATVASSAAPVSTSSSSSSSTGKRGLAYNDASLLPGFVSSNSKVSWCYNWASSTSTIPSGIEYVPLLWGMKDEFTSVWNAHADAALAAGSTHLMGFNEPDYSGQANLAVSDAVSGWMTYMQPYASKAKIGAPAVTNGGSPMGLTYLANFVSALKTAGGSYDFCSVHWYDSATNIAYFKNFMQDAATACGGKKVWLTEFGASGSADEQNTFLETVLPWMDSQDYIERYSYFMVTPGNLISSGTTLSTLGNTYATFT